MATALDIITRSLRDLGVLGMGEVPDADQAANGLVSLNDLMESLANENLMIYATTETPITMTGALSYDLLRGSHGYQVINFAGAVVGTDNYGTVSAGVNYTLRITIDGGSVQLVYIPRDVQLTYNDVVSYVNASITGAAMAIIDGNLRVTSDSIGSASIVLIEAAQLNPPDVPFAGFVRIDPAVNGNSSETARYTNLDNAYFTLNGSDYPVSIITKEQYQDISNKALTSSLPSCVMYDTQFPTGVLYVYPAPSSGTLTLSGRKPFTAFTALTDTIDFPPGYSAMLRANLANDMQSEYGKNRQKISMDAQRLKANLKRTNHKPSVMTSDIPMSSNRNSYLIERGY